MNLFPKQGLERQTQNGWMDPEWKKGGEMSWDVLTDVYTLPYIK